jgi:hypothetical protein
VNGFQGKENMIQVIDCVMLGGGANEAMDSLGVGRRRFDVAMSSGNVSCIVSCSEDNIKGKCHCETCKQFLADPEISVQGDHNFLTEWEDNILLRKFEAVRKDWLKSNWLAVS